MSAKEAFFKKLEGNLDAQKASEAAFQKDVTEFKEDTLALLNMIKSWFDGSPVKSQLSTTPLSIEGKGFDFPSLTLRNGNKSLTIDPEGLYYFGITGVLKVVIDNPNASSRRVSLGIHWKDKRSTHPSWVIVYKTQPIQLIEFNQDNFFGCISEFA